MNNPNEVTEQEVVALYRKHSLFLHPMQRGQMAQVLSDFIQSRSATSDGAIVQPPTASNFIRTSEHIEILATLLHFVPTGESDLQRDLNAFCHDARTSLNKAAQPAADNDLLSCDISARPLSNPLSDYHQAMSKGPLNFTWRDKPHRLVYDLIAAVKWYAIASTSTQTVSTVEPTAQPVTAGQAANLANKHGRRTLVAGQRTENFFTNSQLMALIDDVRATATTPPPVAKVEPTAQPCPNAISMGKHACTNRAQCWEPCGELGHSAEHARVSTVLHVAQPPVAGGQEMAKLATKLTGVWVFMPEGAAADIVSEAIAALKVAVLTLSKQEGV